MDYKGKSLDQLMKEKEFLEGLSKQAVISIFIQGLKNLQKLHSIGIVHFDLKPANLCLPYDKNGSFNDYVKQLSFVDFAISDAYTLLNAD